MAGTPKPGRITELAIETVVTIPATLPLAVTRIGGVQDCDLKISVTTIDVTDKDSDGWDEFLAGQGSASIDGTCVYEEDDLGQEKFIDAILAKTMPKFRFRPWGATPTADEWVVIGFPTSATISSPNKDALSFPFSIQISGKPTRSNQP